VTFRPRPLRRIFVLPSTAARLAAVVALLLVPAVVATCRLDDLLRPMGDVAIVVNVASDPLAVADSLEVSPQVTVDGEPRARLAELVVWSTSDASVATVDQGGVVRGVGRGKAVLTARIPRGAIIREDVEGSHTVWVIADSVAVAPGDTTLAAPGDTLCVRSAAFDARGDTIPNATPDSLTIVSDPDSTIRRVETEQCMGIVARANGAPATVQVALDTATSDARVHVVIPRPPDPASDLAQFRSDGDTPIDQGESIGETTVIFQGQVNDPDAADQLRLQVELKPLGTNFDGKGTAVGAAVANGSTASLTMSAIPDDANYHWRARAVDQTGRTSAVWTHFGDNPESQADFHIPSVPEDPNAPTELAQFQSDGETPIPPGDLAHQTSVVLEGRVTDPDAGDQLTLEVEVQPVGASFDNAATATSATHESGDIASVSVSGLSEDEDYRWQARTVDQTGKGSPWVGFGEAEPAAADFRVAVPTPPNAPDQLSQALSDGSPISPVGATIDERAVVFKARVSDPDPGDQIRIEVETKPVAEEFDGEGTVQSAAVASGADASVTVADQADDTDYHWRVRAVDQSGLASSWVAFGGNADLPLPAATDYRIAEIPEPPASPTGLDQFTDAGATELAIGATTDDPTVVFKASVTDPDPSASIRLEVEAKPVGTDFDGMNTHFEGVGVASGGTAEVTVTLDDNTRYHWRARARDETDSVSAWVNFPEGAETDPDFTVDVGPDPPDDPTGLDQLKTDRLTRITVGGTTNEDAVVFLGVVSDPDPGDQIRLQVEVKPIDVEFDETGTEISTLVPSGETASLTIGSQDDNTDYHWQARAIDEDGTFSGWVSFAPNDDGSPPVTPADVDYRVQVRDPPLEPADLEQLDTELVSLGTGDMTDQSTVVFRATVTDSDPPDATLRLEVEVKPVTVAFNGLGTDSSAAVDNGTTAQVTRDGLSDDTNYHWRARTITDDTRASDWVSFGGNFDQPDANPADTDFRVAVPEAPFAPADTDLRQLRSGGFSVIEVGDTSRTNTVVLRARLADPDAGDRVRLEVEWQRVGIDFFNTARASSVFVASGDTAVAEATELTDDDAYHWQARTVDQDDQASDWVSFGSNGEPDGVDFHVWIPERPALPTAPAQLRRDGTEIPTGGVTDEATVIFQAGVSDPDPGDSVRIQIERRKVQEPLQGTPTPPDGTLVASGQTSTVTVTSHDDNAGYHWQVRSVDKLGKWSPWVVFPQPTPNGESDTDYYVNSVPQVPSPPPTVGQFRTDGTAIPVGGNAPTNLTNATVVFKATGFDPDPGDSLFIEVEARLVGTSFRGSRTHAGSMRVPSGGTAEYTATFPRPLILGSDAYHWQARVCDGTAADSCSEWVPFGDNAESAADFRVQGTL
jgi:hypothetical protein